MGNILGNTTENTMGNITENTTASTMIDLLTDQYKYLESMFLKPQNIYYPSYSFKNNQINKHEDYTYIEVENYDVETILEKIKEKSPKYHEIISTALNSKNFKELNMTEVKDVHFINSFVDSIVHIRNKKGSEDVVTIKITNETDKEISQEIKDRNEKKIIREKVDEMDNELDDELDDESDNELENKSDNLTSYLDDIYKKYSLD